MNPALQCRCGFGFLGLLLCFGLPGYFCGVRGAYSVLCLKQKGIGGHLVFLFKRPAARHRWGCSFWDK